MICMEVTSKILDTVLPAFWFINNKSQMNVLACVYLVGLALNQGT